MWIPPEIGRPDGRNHTRPEGGEMTRSAARRGAGHAWVRSGLLLTEYCLSDPAEGRRHPGDSPDPRGSS